MRSEWPTWAPPSPLLVQLLQVWSALSVKARPLVVEPVSMSCVLGVSPAPLITLPFSSSAVCLKRLLPRRASSIVSPLSSARFSAIGTRLELYQGPCPIRSRALTAGTPGRAWVERYARQVLPPPPTAAASPWQWASAPASPPRSPPLPIGTLVTKKLIGCGCGPGAWACASEGARSSAHAATVHRVLVIPDLLRNLVKLRA